MCVDANVTRIILTVINCDPFEVCFVAIDGLKAREIEIPGIQTGFSHGAQS